VTTTPQPFLLVLSALVAYILGGLPFGYWFMRLTSGKDIRTMGSGNIGATNVQRTAGTKAGLIVLALDILKGLAAVWIVSVLTHNDPLALALSSAGVVIGHCYPLFLGFKGGKAVACFIGVYLFLAPLALLIVTIAFVATVAVSKHISLGSIVGAAAFPFVYWGLYRPAPALLIAAVLSCLLIIYRHRSNIERLRRGQESVFSFKSRPTV
jgi:acyl phosphate:glycerol-3-phosphate acyltransferase